MLTDLRNALRQLRKDPGFTATAIVILALGIGATTAVFTIVHQVMLKSLPVSKPEELWRIGDEVRCCNWGGYSQGDDGKFSLFSWELYKHFRTNTVEFTDLAAFQAGNAPLAVRRVGSQAPVDNRNGQYVSGNFFRTFGINPWIGRLLTDEDDKEGAPLVAVMSYRIWKEKYGQDPSVVGGNYQINGHPFTIIGVSAPGFLGAKMTGGAMPDFWMPLTAELIIDGQTARLKRPNGNFLDLIGRTKPGTAPKTLEAKLRVELHDWLASHVSDMEPSEKEVWQKQTLRLVPGGGGVSDMKAHYKDGLKLLFLGSACVLLVACGNLANLMLVRGLKNRAQISVRVALGASRSQLVRKALTESVTLSIIGGLAGVAVAYGSTKLIIYLAFGSSANHFVPLQANPSPTMLLFTFGLSILTGVLFGIAPAWITSHAQPVEALRGANRSVGGSKSWTQKALVIIQAAMSLALLSTGALLGKTLSNLENQDFGFESNGRYIAWINPMLTNYKPEQLDPLFKRVEERLRQIPGVRMVSSSLYAPMSGDSWNDVVRIEGRPEPTANENTSASLARITPGFFETIGAKVLVGRGVTESDTNASRKIAVVNEAFAKKFFPGESPIGKHFGVDRLRYATTYEIVGVTNDIRYLTYGFKNPVKPMFWLAEAQTVDYGDDEAMRAGELWSHYLNNIVLWVPGNPPQMEAKVREALASVDPNLVLYGVDAYKDAMHEHFQQENMIATLTMLFGVLGLTLAAVGLYGVTSYTVEQRTSEIGVRMALGADRWNIVKLILRGAFSQVGVGLLFGIPAALGAGKLVADQLFQIEPMNPLMILLATILLGAAALFASVIPAQRAASIEPVRALRSE